MNDLRQELEESANSTTDFVESKALAQPEQEPVAGMFEEKLPDQNPPSWVRDYKPKREWVGLEDEDVATVKNEFNRGALWAEAKLKEKNT